ncbi:sensor histidine kinase [Ideonella paludis]|uniref:histidine kinase n=1 Tax=Ideonella paludis TaxID=1233411 RepID=A0ABS5DTW9_9BURK|nr:ATP-binding protein [Ideonella paludis]MBQ0934544.1 GHKL domain-containing protein [Ideonella paludis]
MSLIDHGLSQALRRTLWGWLCCWCVLLSGCGVWMPQHDFTVYASAKSAELFSPDQALKSYLAGAFERKDTGFGRGYQRQPMWLAVQFSSSPPGTASVVSVGPAILDSIEAYTLDATGHPIFVGRSGIGVPRQSRSGATLEHSFVIKPERPGPTLVLLKVKSSASMAVYAQVTSAEYQLESLRLQGLGFGILFGLMCACLATAGLAFLRSRNGRVAVWLAQTGAGLLFVLCFNGMLSILLLDFSLQAYSWLLTTSGALMLVSVVLFMGRYLSLAEDYPRLHATTLAMSWLVIPVALVMDALGWSLFLGLALVLLPTMACMGLGLLLQTLRGHPKARSQGIWGWLLGAAFIYQYGGKWGYWSFGAFNMTAWQYALFICYCVILVDLVRGLAQTHGRARLRRQHLQAQLMAERSSLQEKVLAGTSALQTLHEDLRREERAQRDLLLVAAQEFQPPARRIRRLLDDLRLRPGSQQSNLAERLRNMGIAADRLQFLANKLISAERIDELTIHPEFHAVSVTEWVHEVLHDTVLFIHTRGLEHVQGVQVSGDPVLLRIALQNLIDNAIRHTDAQEGSVSLEVLQHPQEIELIIADQGPGIPDSLRPHLFQRYTNAQRKPGHGLGLSIVAAIARSHQGQVSVSDAQPHGARFHLRLPSLPTLSGAESSKTNAG